MSLQRYVFCLDSARKMGENFEKQYIFKLLPLQGALLTARYGVNIAAQLGIRNRIADCECTQGAALG